MTVTQVNGVTINKLNLSKYRELKSNGQLATNESYVITDIDEQLPIYKESLDNSKPIILRDLDTGIYKIYGFFKYYSSYSGISAVDPFAYVIVEKGLSYSYVTVIASNESHNYKITDSSYEDLNDSGWIEATLTSNFTNYSTNTTPEYRKTGKQVEIRGVVKPTATITASNTGVTIFTLPEGYRPTKTVFEICQGSGRNVWLLNINTNGTVTISRYGTTSNIDITASAWLCFNKTFLIN